MINNFGTIMKRKEKGGLWD